MNNENKGRRLRTGCSAILSVTLFGGLVVSAPPETTGKTTPDAPIATPQTTEGASQGVGKPRPDPPPKIPVVTFPQMYPKELREWQLDEIIVRAKASDTEGRKIWSVLLFNNAPKNGMPHYRVAVFYEPDVSTPRIRRGKKVTFGWRMGFGDAHTVEPGRLRSYVQVALKDRPFGKSLEPPSGTLIPFNPPMGFTDEEIVEIVDFIRGNPAEPDKRYPNKLDSSRSILSIRRRGDKIEVRCGWMATPKGGLGQIIQMVKEGGTFRVISIKKWKA